MEAINHQRRVSCDASVAAPIAPPPTSEALGPGSKTERGAPPSWRPSLQPYPMRLPTDRVATEGSRTVEGTMRVVVAEEGLMGLSRGIGPSVLHSACFAALGYCALMPLRRRGLRSSSGILKAAKGQPQRG